MSTYVPAFRTITKEKAVEFLQKKYGERTDEFLTAFEKAYPGYQPKDLWMWTSCSVPVLWSRLN